MNISKSVSSKASKPSPNTRASKPKETNNPSPSPTERQTPNSAVDKSVVSRDSQQDSQVSQRVSELMSGLSGWTNSSTEDTTEPETDSTPEAESESPELSLAQGELLRQGTSSPEQVNQLQDMLNQQGHQLETDGVFGPLTEAAVRQFQTQRGLSVDGIVGPETMSALNGGSSAQEPADPNTRAEQIAGSEQTAAATAEQGIENPSSSEVEGGGALAGLPDRPANALGGQDFMNSIEHMRPGRERDQAILQEILSGNIPDNSRNLQNLTIQRDGREIQMQVMPDYLAIGSNEDSVRIPMTPAVAQAVADRTGMSLPTDRIVDDIHNQAQQLHLDPFAWREGNQHARNMESIGYYNTHDQRIDRQLGSGTAPSQLVSGHKKDLVIPHRDGRVAIYGGRWSDGRRVQSYSNVHHAGYEDYSHGARLVSQEVTVDGQSMTLQQALADPNLAGLFTNQRSGSWSY